MFKLWAEAGTKVRYDMASRHGHPDSQLALLFAHIGLASQTLFKHRDVIGHPVTPWLPQNICEVLTERRMSAQDENFSLISALFSKSYFVDVTLDSFSY